MWFGSNHEKNGFFSYAMRKRCRNVFSSGNAISCQFFFFFLIEGSLLSNVVVVSAIHQHKSVITLYIYINLLSLLSLPLPPFHPSKLSQSARLGSLYYRPASCQLSILHMMTYRCQCYFLNLTHPLLPLLCQLYSNKTFKNIKIK